MKNELVAFVNMNIPYVVDKVKISAMSQAENIFDIIHQLKDIGTKGFAITYSANYGQTRDLQRAYMDNHFCAKIMGSNQAQVVFEIERMLAGVEAEFQNLLRIAPITTMNAYNNPVPNWNSDVLFGIIQSDLDRIENYLLNGWTILGWQNQDTVNKVKSPYAIGGGVVKLPHYIHEHIQDRLKEFANIYDKHSSLKLE